MTLKSIFLPWAEIKALRESAQHWNDAYWRLVEVNGRLLVDIKDLRAQLSKFSAFDADNDGKPGGSRKKS